MDIYVVHSKSAIGYNVQWWNCGKLVFINPIALTAKILSFMSVIYQRCSYTNYRVLISYVQNKLEFLYHGLGGYGLGGYKN